jgi:hypothetical protein
MQSSGMRISDMAVRSVLDARTGKIPRIGAVAGVMKPSNPLGPDAMAFLALVMTQSTTDTRFELAGRPAFLFEDAKESELVLFPADNAFIVLNSLKTSKVLGVGAALGRVFDDLPLEV